MPITETPLPIKKSGRTFELDTSTVDEIVAALTERPSVNGRPNAVGPTKPTFDTKGKASNNGQHYQKAVADRMKLTIRLNVYEPREGAYLWRLYVAQTQEGDTPTEATGES